MKERVDSRRVVAKLCAEAMQAGWPRKSAIRFVRNLPASVARHLGGVEEATAVATAGMFMSARKYADGHESGTSFKTYQFRGVRNALGNWRADAERNQRLFVSLERIGDDGSELLADRRRVIPSEVLDVKEALGALNGRELEVIRKCYWEGLGLTGAAEALGVSSQWANQVHQDAVAKMFDFFEGTDTAAALKQKRLAYRRHLYSEKKKMEAACQA